MEPLTEHVNRQGVKLKLPDSVIDDYQAGVSARELARQHGVSLPGVLAFLDRHGVPRRRGVRPWVRRDLPVREVVDLYDSGWTATELGRRYDVDDGTICRLLRDAGINTRGPGAPPFAAAFEDDYVVIDIPKAIEMLQRGWRLSAIAEHFDADTDDLREALTEAGVEFRGGGKL